MPLSDTQKKHLRSLGHQLKPVIIVGEGGLSASVLEELETTLSHHELIKVSIRVGDRALRDATINEIAARSTAMLVQRIGNMALFYRENPDKKGVRVRF